MGPTSDTELSLRSTSSSVARVSLVVVLATVCLTAVVSRRKRFESQAATAAMLRLEPAGRLCVELGLSLPAIAESEEFRTKPFIRKKLASGAAERLP